MRILATFVIAMVAVTLVAILTNHFTLAEIAGSVTGISYVVFIGVIVWKN